MDNIAEKSRRSVENGIRETPLVPSSVQRTHATKHPFVVKKAKCTVDMSEESPGSATFTARLLDSSGSEYGDTLTVYYCMNKTTSVYEGAFWPVLNNGHSCWVSRDEAGDWILVRPDIQAATECE